VKIIHQPFVGPSGKYDIQGRGENIVVRCGVDIDTICEKVAKVGEYFGASWGVILVAVIDDFPSFYPAVLSATLLS
jgi:hypothetical protein